MTYEQQIAAIIAEIEPVLKSGLDAEAYAAGMLEEADDLGINGVNELHLEVRGSHTRSGRPHAFTLRT